MSLKILPFSFNYHPPLSTLRPCFIGEFWGIRFNVHGSTCKHHSLISVWYHCFLLTTKRKLFFSSDVFTHRLSTVTSEAVAYRRIISERQNSTDDSENHCIISRWSTPPKFGLSPPGNSRLAKRRSLKQRLSGLSLNGISSTSHPEEEGEKSESPTTPVQSPDDIAGTPVNERRIHRRGVINSPKSNEGENNEKNSQKELMFEHVSKNGVINLSPDYSSADSTPVATPRAGQPLMKMF